MFDNHLLDNARSYGKQVRLTDRIDPYADVAQIYVFGVVVVGRTNVHINVVQRALIVGRFGQTPGRFRIVVQGVGQTLEGLLRRLADDNRHVSPVVIADLVRLLAVHAPVEFRKLQQTAGPTHYHRHKADPTLVLCLVGERGRA